MSFQLPGPEPNMNYDKLQLEDLLKLLKVYAKRSYYYNKTRNPFITDNVLYKTIIMNLIVLIIRSPLGLITLIKKLIKGELPKSLWSTVILTLITSGFSIYRIYKLIDLIIGSNKNYNRMAAQFKDWYINVYSKQNV